MTQFVRICLKIACLCLVLWLTVSLPAQAGELGSGGAAHDLFTAQCAGCHPNGGNIVRRGKSLKQRALKRNGLESVAAIAALITNGKGSMSAYGDRLSPQEIEQLAAYVWDRAQNNWR